MIVFSNCKINIGLNIASKRTDGYHDLETIFYPLPLFDVLELVDAEKTEITVLGNDIGIKAEENIIYKAWFLLSENFQQVKPIHFFVLKNIPAGAGLGAGSANGAFTLLAINKKFGLNLSHAELIDYSLQLGSDCPFFIKNKPVFAGGRGELFEDIKTDLSGYKIIIVNPRIHVSTPWAFKQIIPKIPAASLKHLIEQPVATWQSLITNDFEHPVFNKYPEIKKVKTALYNAGATFASMSGSGSTVYGLFLKNAAPNLSFPENYFIKEITL